MTHQCLTTSIGIVTFLINQGSIASICNYCNAITLYVCALGQLLWGSGMKNIQINGASQKVDGDDEMPLLWFLRENMGLKGTKYGCGIGQCGACTVHINGEAIRSCSITLDDLENDTNITTIEGLANTDGTLHPVQQAWIEEDVAMCGYCQAGQIMAASALLAANPAPTDTDIDENQDNLCRCGSYFRIRKAIHRASDLMAGGNHADD